MPREVESLAKIVTALGESSQTSGYSRCPHPEKQTRASTTLITLVRVLGTRAKYKVALRESIQIFGLPAKSFVYS